MGSIMKQPKFPKFMALLYSNGLDIKRFADLLQEKGHKEYKYSTVRKKLKGESPLSYEDIIVFSKVMETSENIFFNLRYTKCIPKRKEIV